VQNILLISLGRNGGLPKYAAGIAAGLRQGGKPFHAVCASTSEHPIPGAWRVPTYSGMASLLLSSLTVLPLLLLALAFVALRNRSRVVYFPYVHTWTPVIGLFFRLLGARVVVTFHDYVPHLGESGVLSRLVLRISALAASHLVFLSEHVRREAIADRASIADRSCVIPHGIFSLPGLPEKSPHALHKKLTSVLFIGRISPYKGVELLLQAYAQSSLRPGVRLTIAGKANYELDRQLLVEGVDYIDRFLDESEMARLLADADVIVLPYLEATQSGVVTLAIDSATPVIATDVGGLGEQLQKDEALFVPPTVAALREALEAIGPVEVRARLSAALLARKSTMDWQRLAARVHDFCMQATEKGH
jgi:glycosyltransferase involved in cell wall biosynthesis